MSTNFRNALSLNLRKAAIRSRPAAENSIPAGEAPVVESSVGGQSFSVTNLPPSASPQASVAPTTYCSSAAPVGVIRVRECADDVSPNKFRAVDRVDDTPPAFLLVSSASAVPLSADS